MAVFLSWHVVSDTTREVWRGNNANGCHVLLAWSLYDLSTARAMTGPSPLAAAEKDISARRDTFPIAHTLWTIDIHPFHYEISTGVLLRFTGRRRLVYVVCSWHSSCRLKTNQR